MSRFVSMLIPLADIKTCSNPPTFLPFNSLHFCHNVPINDQQRSSTPVPYLDHPLSSTLNQQVSPFVALFEFDSKKILRLQLEATNHGQLLCFLSTDLGQH